MQLFLMTAITEEELQFGMHNRALDLYHRLRHAGKAYISDLDRPSVLHLTQLHQFSHYCELLTDAALPVQIDLRRDSDRIADEAAASGDLATLGGLLNSGYRVFPGNPILCLAVKKGRDDRSAANVLRFFMDKRWKDGGDRPSNGQAERDGAESESERERDRESRGGEGARNGSGSGDVGSTDEELVRSLAQVRDEDNYTALHWAARNNFAECAQLLVEKGAVDVELRGTRTAVTALHLAANFGYALTLQL
jgi:hypothetical protein